MMRSLYSAVSGLRNHQTRMDVIANNISNVNTVGFKASRVIFQDIYSQTARNASSATADPSGTGYALGGTNPSQIGLGLKLAAIDVIHNPAATTRTDNPLDIAIEGDGFFIIQQGSNTFYTRAGNFYVDNAGNLVTTSGDFVLGIAATVTPYDPNDPTTPPSSTMEPPSNDALLGAYERGELSAITGLNDYINISIDETGVIRGIAKGDESGTKVVLGKLLLAVFDNPTGLEKKGNSLYAATPNSGEPGYNEVAINGAGKMNVGGLEMSNVDLSGEFTDMIITQRGFQANSRVITVSDTLLEELVNLKR